MENRGRVKYLKFVNEGSFQREGCLGEIQPRPSYHSRRFGAAIPFAGEVCLSRRRENFYEEKDVM